MTGLPYMAANLPPGTYVDHHWGPLMMLAPTGWVRVTSGAAVDPAVVDRAIGSGARVYHRQGSRGLQPVRDVLAAGLRWLYDVHQPDTAVVQHHGFGVPVGDRALSFLPTVSPVLVVAVLDPRPSKDGFGNPYPGPDETAWWAQQLAQHRRRVVSSWNGTPGDSSVSLRLDGHRSPTLAAALDRYYAGCPVHQSVFCTPTGNGCTWFVAGAAAVVAPRFPTVPTTPQEATR